MFFSKRVTTLQQGVNLYGYAYAEHGVGQVLRLFAEIADGSELDYAVIPYIETYSRQEAVFTDFGTGESGFDVNIICVNADTVPRFVECVGSELLEGRYNIGVWAWEVEDLPDWMAESSQYLDEIWGISRFTADSISGAVSCPVAPFTLPVSVPRPISKSRSELELSDDFLFLFCLDFNSILKRKNALGLIAAFKQAFSPGEPVQLVIKTINGTDFPTELLRLNAAASRHDRIHVVDGYLPADGQLALMAACDSYVSLHRSEGFGFTMAEAMALGKPVIGTAYSGNLDFMSEENSYLVPFDLVEVGEGAAPYPPGSRWADPDLDTAAALMRRVYERPEEAAAKGVRAREDIERHHTPAARVRHLQNRIDLIHGRLSDRPAASAGPYAVLRFDEGQTKPSRPDEDLVVEMNGGEFVRGHRGFEDVPALMKERIQNSFTEDKVATDLVCGGLDGIEWQDDGSAVFWGWAYDPRSRRPARAAVLLVDGEQMPLEIQLGAERTDVADRLGEKALRFCGWMLSVPAELSPPRTAVFAAYALLDDGLFGQLPQAESAAPQPGEGSRRSSEANLLEEIRIREAELEEAARERDEARRRLDELVVSRSWRFTATLRSAMGVLKR